MLQENGEVDSETDELEQLKIQIITASYTVQISNVNDGKWFT